MHVIHSMRHPQWHWQAAGKRLQPVDPYARTSPYHLTLVKASLHGLSRTGIEFLSEDVRDA